MTTVLVVGLVALVLVVFGPTVLELKSAWDKDPNYSHGYLIPIIFGLLVWRYWRETPLPAEGDAFLGGSSILAGSCLHLGAMLTGWPPLDFLGLVFVLRGLAVTMGGREWAAGLWFPLLFLFFMFPLPATWTGYAALWLQDWVSRMSAGVLELFVVCRRQGNTLFLAGVGKPLVVAQECSGLRQIVAFVALGALLGHLSRKPWLCRLLLFVAAVPIAILANAIRVLLMGFGALWFGAGWIDTWLHHAPAVLSLPIGIALYLFTFYLFGLIWASPQEPGEQSSREELSNQAGDSS